MTDADRVPSAVFAPGGTWMLAFAPVPVTPSMAVIKVLRIEDGDDSYVQVFTSPDRAERMVECLAGEGVAGVESFIGPSGSEFAVFVSTLPMGIRTTHIVFDPEPNSAVVKVPIAAVCQAYFDRAFGKPPHGRPAGGT